MTYITVYQNTTPNIESRREFRYYTRRTLGRIAPHAPHNQAHPPYKRPESMGDSRWGELDRTFASVLNCATEWMCPNDPCWDLHLQLSFLAYRKKRSQLYNVLSTPSLTLTWFFVITQLFWHHNVTRYKQTTGIANSRREVGGGRTGDSLCCTPFWICKKIGRRTRLIVVLPLI